MTTFFIDMATQEKFIFAFISDKGYPYFRQQNRAVLVSATNTLLSRTTSYMRITNARFTAHYLVR